MLIPIDCNQLNTASISSQLFWFAMIHSFKILMFYNVHITCHLQSTSIGVQNDSTKKGNNKQTKISTENSKQNVPFQMTKLKVRTKQTNRKQLLYS